MKQLSQLAERVAASPWIRWTVFLACLTAFLYANFKPSPPKDVFAHSDKFSHFFVFTALTFLGVMRS